MAIKILIPLQISMESNCESDVMSRLEQCFTELASESKTALIPYIMTGDPYLDVTVPLMHAMVDAGANIIELGAPFSDPMADGPVIQAASERALAHGISLETVFEAVRQFREKDDKTPIIMMGYLNPIEVMGYEAFSEAAAESGIDGVITVDMPPEEGHDYVKLLKKNAVDPVFLVAPTSTDERIKMIANTSGGFVYYVSLKGVTGAASLDVEDVAAKLNNIRKYTDLPVGVGFGISDAEAARSVSKCSDAVVVGSAIVKRMAAEDEPSEAQTNKIIAEVTALLNSMRNAMDE